MTLAGLMLMMLSPNVPLNKEQSMHRYLRRILAVAAVATAIIFTANLGLAYAAPSSVPSDTSAQLYRETVTPGDRDTCN